jgi:hypothetical protein
MFSRHWILLLAVCLCLLTTASSWAVSVNTISGQMSAIVNRSNISRNTWTILVQNDTGTITYYQLNPTTPRRPASVTKLFTTAAAFGLLGPGSSFDGGTVQSRSVPINTNSDNEIADRLLRHIGSVRRGSSTFSAGAAETIAWCNSVGVNMSGAVMNDGSGLSWDNRFTATQLVTLIRYMNTNFTTWSDTMALGCSSGTLASRYCGTVGSGRVRAKTGTLPNGQTVSLAGFMTNPSDGRRYLFAFIANNVTNLDATRQAIDDAVNVLGQSGIANDPNTGTNITLDNAIAGYSETGTWGDSVSTGYYRTNSRFANTGSGGAATFRPSIPSAAVYDVYGWWVSGTNRATNAVYQINHAGGTSNVAANQSLNGGQWNLLGTFTFNAGTNGTIVLTTQGESGKVVSADAIQLRFKSSVSNSIFVDNGTSDFTASSNWFPSTSVPGYYGANYHARATEAVSDPAVWRATLPSSGSYRVYARWAADSNRAASAPYQVLHAGGTTTVNVNQQQNNNTWVLLGTFNFNAGTADRVRLSCWTTAGFYVIADAIRFDPI